MSTFEYQVLDEWVGKFKFWFNQALEKLVLAELPKPFLTLWSTVKDVASFLFIPIWV